ncbi:hypothetical protein KSS87_002490, partial [Heliosperma pusillum]
KREDAARGLGHTNRSDVVFPISRKHSSESGEASSLPNNPVGKFCQIVMDIPDNIRTDEEVHSSFKDDVHGLLLLNERDSELFCKRYMDMMNLIKLKMQAMSEQSSLKKSTHVSSSASTQETRTVDGVGTEQLVATLSFFTSQFIQKVDEFVNEVLTMHESRVIRPIVPKKAKDVIIQPPSFDLFSQFYEDCVKLSDIDQDSERGWKVEEKDDVKGDANVNGKEDKKDDVKEDANVNGKEDDILVDDYLVDRAGGNDCFYVGDNVGVEIVKDDKEKKTFTEVSAHEQHHDDLFVTAEDAEAVMAESADLLKKAATERNGMLEDNTDFRS